MKNLTQNITLLYIEDDPLARELTQIILKRFFKVVILAEDGEEALEKFNQHTIDFVITDIYIPKLNGIQLIRAIREQNRNIPIIIISSYLEPHYLQEAISLKVEGYLSKPLNPQELEQLIVKSIKKIEAQNREDKRLELLEQYQSIADRSSIISKANPDGIITYVNEKFCTVSGYTPDELIGRNHNIVRAKDVPAELFQDLWHTIKEKKETWKGIIRNRAKNGEHYYVNATIKPILNKDGEIVEYIALRSLITDIIHPKQQLFDLLNIIEKPLVVLIQIEEFNYIDNILEKEESQALQKNVAKELFTRQIGKLRFSKIYLLGKGRFVFVQDMKECIKKISEITKQLKAFQKRINLSKIKMESIDYNLSIMMSLSYGKNAFESAEVGLQKLRQTKENFIIESNSFLIQKENSLKEIETLKMLQKAIDSYNIISYFQPIVNNKTKDIEKYESLVRLIDAKGNTLSPYSFLETSKKSRYYAQITSIVLENSFKALHDTDMNISINLSVLDIERQETRKMFFNLLSQYHQDAHRIILEVIEDENIQKLETIKSFISKIQSYGVKIAIDDFGTGYSNFQRILEYHPDFIKIDGSLIKNIEESQLSLDIVSSIVTFAQKQNIKTIAEFVENERIYQRLCELGVDYSQGYYFGKPTVLI